MEPRVICVIGGGQVYRIEVPGGRSYLFEMPHLCFPTPLKADYSERKLKGLEEMRFLQAVSLWCQQGKRIGKTIRDVALCVYES